MLPQIVIIVSIRIEYDFVTPDLLHRDLVSINKLCKDDVSFGVCTLVESVLAGESGLATPSKVVSGP